MPRNTRTRTRIRTRTDRDSIAGHTLAVFPESAHMTMAAPRCGLQCGAMRNFDDTVFALLARAHAHMVRAAQDMLMDCGVSALEARILNLVPADGRSCATDIARVLEVPVSTVTRALRRMEGYEYLTVRKGWFLDARVLRPELTLLGRQIAENAAGFERDIDGILLAGISQTAFAGLLALFLSTPLRSGTGER